MEDSISTGSDNKLPLIIAVVAVGAALLALLFAFKARGEAKSFQAQLEAATTELRAEVAKAGAGAAKTSDVTAISEDLGAFKAAVAANYDKVAAAVTAQNRVIEGLVSKKSVAPAAAANGEKTATAAAPAAGAGEYAVKSGDTFAKIAKANGVSLSALTAANPGVNPAKLKVGQVIKLPAKK